MRLGFLVTVGPGPRPRVHRPARILIGPERPRPHHGRPHVPRPHQATAHQTPPGYQRGPRPHPDHIHSPTRDPAPPTLPTLPTLPTCPPDPTRDTGSTGSTGSGPHQGPNAGTIDPLTASRRPSADPAALPTFPPGTARTRRPSSNLHTLPPDAISGPREPDPARKRQNAAEGPKAPGRHQDTRSAEKRQEAPQAAPEAHEKKRSQQTPLFPLSYFAPRVFLTARMISSSDSRPPFRISRTNATISALDRDTNRFSKDREALPVLIYLDTANRTHIEQGFFAFASLQAPHNSHKASSILFCIMLPRFPFLPGYHRKFAPIPA